MLRDEQRDNLFRECRQEAFHLEVRDDYAVPMESGPFRRFLDNEPDDYAWFHDWDVEAREITGRGVVLSRVRVVTVPHTDYQRWGMVVAAHNVAAGEDIRYLPRHLAGAVPPDDWWLFDGELVAYNLVDDDGKAVGMALTSDPHIAAYCRDVKSRLWDLATPYADYVDQVSIHQQ
ncbi:DUF6879 family protein [Nocardia sp. CA-129566]|uniref:DUF6879 family protein n=1 Tax=Nocardia sp. CA-129566 TaxID=3239976 RepID=UPI003D9840DE